jgi:hypothetical protein
LSLAQLTVTLGNGVTPTPGVPIDILDWSTLGGPFPTVHLPTLPAFLSWNTSQLPINGILSVTSTLPGDYNGNGIVDAADYVVWRKDPASYGGDPAGYNTWRTHFGQTAGSGSGASVHTAVPEPPTLALLPFGVAAWCVRRRYAV